MMLNEDVPPLLLSAPAYIIALLLRMLCIDQWSCWFVMG